MTDQRHVKAIVAMDPNHVIGTGSGFPEGWDYPADLQYFREATANSTVLMGKGTYLSLPEGRRPLPGRLNVVVTSNPDGFSAPPEVMVISDPVKFIEDFLRGAGTFRGDTLWIIGGGQIYAATMSLWDELHLTIVSREHEGQVKFPKFREYFVEDESRRREDDGCTFHVFVRSDGLPQA